MNSDQRMRWAAARRWARQIARERSPAGKDNARCRALRAVYAALGPGRDGRVGVPVSRQKPLL